MLDKPRFMAKTNNLINFKIKKNLTYKTASVERRDHIASPRHYGTWPRVSLSSLGESQSDRAFPCSAAAARTLHWTAGRGVKESKSDTPVGIGGGVPRFSRRR